MAGGAPEGGAGAGGLFAAFDRGAAFAAGFVVAFVDPEIFFAVGAALTLDEFALWFNLADVYWTPEGVASVRAVFLFGAALSVGFWGGPFIHALARDLFHGFKTSRS